MHGHLELFIRSWTALVLAALGLCQIFWPRLFFGACGFFKWSRSKMTPAMTDRVDRALATRRAAEGEYATPARWCGIFGIAMALCEFVPGISFVLPYALYCLFGAIMTFVQYTHIRRLNDRRAAPLVRRSPFDALPVSSLLALAASFAGVILYGADPKFRSGSIIVAVAMLVLTWIAWQIATSKSVLFGEDPQVEYAVDERLRLMRATNAAALACAPGVVLVGSTFSLVAPAYSAYGIAAFVLTYVAFILVMAVNAFAMRRSIAVRA
jgi:hypothetical protein